MDPHPVLRNKLEAGLLIQEHQQVSDAHLLALALRRGGCLATLDRAVRYLLPVVDETISCCWTRHRSALFVRLYYERERERDTLQRRALRG